MVNLPPKAVAILGGIYFSFSLGYTFYLICDALKNTRLC